MYNKKHSGKLIHGKFNLVDDWEEAGEMALGFKDDNGNKLEIECWQKHKDWYITVIEYTIEIDTGRKIIIQIDEENNGSMLIFENINIDEGLAYIGKKKWKNELSPRPHTVNDAYFGERYRFAHTPSSKLMKEFLKLIRTHVAKVYPFIMNFEDPIV